LGGIRKTPYEQDQIKEKATRLGMRPRAEKKKDELKENEI